MKMLSV